MRRILAAILIAMLGAGPVLAQISRYPALYFVTGVDEGDTLNVRSLPDAESAILEKLAPDARGIEVTAEDASGQWGRINSGELTMECAIFFGAA